MPHDTATVDDLRRQGKWADLYQINVAIDASFAAANLSGTDAATAELVQDYLALHLCIRDFPPNRPTALRLLSIQPGFCLACADAACLGNRVLAVDDGYEVVFEHHKTRARTQAPIRLRVAGLEAVVCVPFVCSGACVRAALGCEKGWWCWRRALVEAA
jgi:hypothetical protein